MNFSDGEVDSQAYTQPLITPHYPHLRVPRPTATAAAADAAAAARRGLVAGGQGSRTARFQKQV